MILFSSILTLKKGTSKNSIISKKLSTLTQKLLSKFAQIVMSAPFQNNEISSPSSTDGIPGSNPGDTSDPRLNELLTRVAGLSEDLMTSHNPNINGREVLLKVSRIVEIYSEIERRIIQGELTRTLIRLGRDEPAES